MKFLRRKVQAAETVREEGRVIHREIEITVEREWLSVASAERGSGEAQAMNTPVLELPALKLESTGG